MLEGGVGQVIGFGRPVGPGLRECGQELLVGIAHPQARFGREPVLPPQPLCRRFEARVVEHIGLVPRRRRFGALPLQSIPLPATPVAVAVRQQPHPHRVVLEFEGELRLGGMGEAQALPIRAVAGARLAQVGEQTMAEFADGHAGLADQVAEQGWRRRVAQEIKGVIHRHQRRLAGKELGRVQRHGLAARQPELLEKSELGVAVLEGGHQFGKLPREEHIIRLTGPLEPGRVAPARQPLEQFDSLQAQRLPRQFAPGVNRFQPFDARPIPRRKQLLLLRRARGQIDQVGHGPQLLARARPKHQELQTEVVQPRLVFPGECPGEDAQMRARGIEVVWGGRQQPVFDRLDAILLALHLFELGQAGQVRVGGHFGRQRPAGAQEQQRGFLNAGATLRGQQPRPPVGAGKILARERELAEVILEQQPGALRIGAVGEHLQQLGALRHGRLGIRQLAPQIGEGAIGVLQHRIARIVLAGQHRPRPVYVFRSRHRNISHSKSCLSYLGRMGRGGQQEK